MKKTVTASIMGRITQPTKVKRGKMWKINKIKTFLKRPKAIV